MAVWLLTQAHSATAQTCTMLATAILVGFKLPSLRSRARHLGIYLSLIAILVVILQSTGAWDALWGGFVRMLGREPELTGRTPIWRAVLKEDINPLFGTGFYSFWTIERARRIADSAGLFYLLNEAHDGYIETYLNSGLIGLTLLVVVIVNAFNRYKKDALVGFGLASLRLAFIIAIVLYNVTESAFDRLTPVRFALLFAIIQWRAPAALRVGATDEPAGCKEPNMEPAAC
jgi:O-antigen ligase